MSDIIMEKADLKTESVSSTGAPFVTDLNVARRAALAEVDNAAFGWFHVRTCLVAGVGFFTDAYGKSMRHPSELRKSLLTSRSSRTQISSPSRSAPS